MGELNGLSVYDVGDYRFGRPTKIPTASVAAGRAGIINIEREADLSGKSHNKGMLVSGYFRARFAQKVPLALSASLAFEAELRRGRRRQRFFDGSSTPFSPRSPACLSGRTSQ